MKKFKKVCSLLLVALLSVVFITGCDVIGGKKKPTKDDVKEKPTFEEIIHAFTETDINHYVNTIQKHFASLSNIELLDVIKALNDIGTVYGAGTIKLPANGDVYRSIVDVGRLTSYASTTQGVNDAIMIVEGATINNGKGKSENIYIVALQGTDIAEGQATGIQEDLLAGLECSNYYLYDAFKAVTDNIPEGSTLYITGLSLGGMVAQQLAGIDYLQENYNVNYLAVIGSALVAPEKIDYKETNTVRYVIPNDVVPTLSNSATEKSQEKVIQAGHNYYKTFVGAHVFGYVNAEIWGQYDVLGNQGGSATITFGPNTKATLYPAKQKEAHQNN